MEQLANLLFVLASSDRLVLLHEIEKEGKLRLGQLADKISATSQETSKHLMRLRNSNLVEKDSDGFFILTQYGKVILTILLAPRFLVKTREYLLSHDISSLPPEFVERIGELEQCEYGQRVGAILAHTRQVVQEADEYIWLMSDHAFGIEEYIEGKKQAGNNGKVTWRIIAPEGANINWTDLRSRIDKNKGRFEFGLSSEEIKVGIAMNEKISGVTFQDTTRKLDFNAGFRSSDPLFHRWSRDIFSFYWNNARKLKI